MEGDANPFDRDSVSNELLKEINRLEKHMLSNMSACFGKSRTAILVSPGQFA